MKEQVKLPAFFESKAKVQKPESSGNRIRNKGHVQGNWATIIFIPSKYTKNITHNSSFFLDVVRGKEREVIDKKVHELSQELNVKFTPVDPLTPEFPFHLSLSRTLYLKHYQKDLFCTKLSDKLQKVLKDFPLSSVEFKSEKLAVYKNDEKTTSFIAVDLENDSRILKYIEVIDSVLKEFALPEYYQSPKLHFSVVWSNQPEVEDVLIGKEKISIEIEHDHGIYIKCGNKLSIIR